MTDDSLILIFCQKLLGTRECNLVDVAVNLLGVHTDASVGDCEGLLVGIHRHANLQVAQLTLKLILRCKGLQLLRSIHRV